MASDNDNANLTLTWPHHIFKITWMCVFSKILVLKYEKCLTVIEFVCSLSTVSNNGNWSHCFICSWSAGRKELLHVKKTNICFSILYIRKESIGHQIYLSKYKSTYRPVRLLSCSFKYTGTLMFVFLVSVAGSSATAMYFSFNFAWCSIQLVILSVKNREWVFLINRQSKS